MNEVQNTLLFYARARLQPIAKRKREHIKTINFDMKWNTFSETIAKSTHKLAAIWCSKKIK